MDKMTTEKMTICRPRALSFADVPFDTTVADSKRFYPRLVAASPTAASFRDEVAT
jgi:hypothetical protein